jgi:nitrogen fixation protein NifB
VADLGADIQNLIPMLPTADTPFVDLPEAGAEAVQALRGLAGAHVAQMTHCKRCRADAVGLLGQDRSDKCAGVLRQCASLEPGEQEQRPHVAVATREGMLVNMHLGEARELQIWTRSNGGFELLETRAAPEPGCGPARWEALANMLQDCRYLLAEAVGETPRRILTAGGVPPVACTGLIATALQLIYSGGDPEVLRGRRKGPEACGGCGDGGGGCG